MTQQINAISIFADSCRLHRDAMLEAADRHIERLEVRIAELRIFKTEIRRATDPLLGLPELPQASAEEEAEIQRIAAMLAPRLFEEDQLAGEALTEAEVDAMAAIMDAGQQQDQAA